MNREPQLRLVESGGKPAAAGWLSRLRAALSSKRPFASRYSRFLARQIAHDYSRPDRGISLAFSGPDCEVEATDATMMLAYCLQSELGAKVLLVDARLRPGVDGFTTRLRLHGLPGFAEMLQGGASGGLALVRPTSVPNVDVLAAGNALAAQACDVAVLREFIALATRDYSFVLLQSGSLLDDTRNLSAVLQADAVFLIAEENLTSMESLDRSRKVLADGGLEDAPVLLTRAQ